MILMSKVLKMMINREIDNMELFHQNKIACQNYMDTLHLRKYFFDFNCVIIKKPHDMEKCCY